MVLVISIFKWVLYSTALASLLSLIILAFKFLIKDKLGVRWHYAIWLIVIIRLLIPYGLESSLSVFNIINLKSSTITQVPYSINNKSINNKSINILINKEKDINVVPNLITSNVQTNTSNTNQSPVYLQLISCLWLLVVILIGSYTIVMTMKLKARFKKGDVCINEDVLLLLLQCKKKLNIKSHIKIIYTNKIKTPCIYGFIKPKLLLPSGIEKYVDKNELEFIILHELAHVKRLDIIVSCLSGILQIIHWFNPIIWYSFYRMRNDKELACDALVLSHVKSGDYINYGKTIIKLLESYKKTPQVYGMSSIISDKSQIKRRITMISLFKKDSYKLTIIPIVTLTLLGGVMLTNAKNKPVLADNKYKQGSKAIATLSNVSKISIERYNTSNGKTFTGNLLIIKDPTRVKVGYSNRLGKQGELTSQIAKDNGAIAAINAGGFYDFIKTESPSGIIMQDGKLIFNDMEDNNSKSDIVAFTNKGTLLVGKYSLNELNKLNATEVVSSGPTLIVNGKPAITQGDGGLGIAPRTAIGQKNDGTIIMLTIDGRSVKSIGATLHDVQNILIEYGAINAANLDGGSSSTMYYKGKVINNPCGGLIESGNVMINDPDNKGEIKVVSTFMVLP